MRADETRKPIKALAREKRRTSRRSADLHPLTRMKKALDRAQRDSHKIIVEEFAPEIPKGINEEPSLKPSTETPVKLPVRDPLKILSH